VTRRRNSDVLMAFDFGLRRLGVATGNLHTRTATPLLTLDVGRELPWSRLDALVAEWSPGRLIVGIPESASGPAPITEQAREFAASLVDRYGLPVETVDEALTSAAATSQLRESRRSGLRRRRVDKGAIDRHAACLIAEQWMSDQGAMNG
jgi:putative holliday junction resolvase